MSQTVTRLTEHRTQGHPLMQDFFLTLGVERKFGFENAALERRFHHLQRESHPDRFAGERAGVVDSALDRSSLINEAYRTLRDPLKRTKHLLALYGFSVGQSKQVPMDLLELVMDVQEKAAEFAGADEAEKTEITGRIQPLLSELNRRKSDIDSEVEKLRSEWDTLATKSEPETELGVEERSILQSIAKALASRAYIVTLLDSLLAASKGESMVLKH